MSLRDLDSLSVSVSVKIVSGLADLLQRGFLLPLPTTQEWGEDRGEGRLPLSPDLRPARSSRGEGENFWWLYQDAPAEVRVSRPKAVGTRPIERSAWRDY